MAYSYPNRVKGVPKNIPLQRIEFVLVSTQHTISVEKDTGSKAQVAIGCREQRTISEWLNDKYAVREAREYGYTDKDIKEYKRILLWVAKFLGETVKVKKPATKKKRTTTTKKAVKKRR